VKKWRVSVEKGKVQQHEKLQIFWTWEWKGKERRERSSGILQGCHRGWKDEP